MVEMGADSFPEDRLEEENGSDDEKAELEACLPKLKAVEGQHDQGGGEEVVHDRGASQKEKATHDEGAHERGPQRGGAEARDKGVAEHDENHQPHQKSGRQPEEASDAERDERDEPDMESADREDVHRAGLAKIIESFAAGCFFAEDDRAHDVGLFSFGNACGDPFGEGMTDVFRPAAQEGEAARPTRGLCGSHFEGADDALFPESLLRIPSSGIACGRSLNEGAGDH